MAIDPICKMEVDEKTAKWSSVYEGKKYYFCAPGCKKMFDRDPQEVYKVILREQPAQASRQSIHRDR